MYNIVGYRLHDFYIGVLPNDIEGKPVPGSYPLCQPQYSGPAAHNDILDLNCNPGTKGRYVLIQVPGNSEILTLCEVEVYGQAIDN